jgi:hypothetical protein
VLLPEDKGDVVLSEPSCSVGFIDHVTLRLWQHCCWWFKSAGLRWCVVGWVVHDFWMIVGPSSSSLNSSWTAWPNHTLNDWVSRPRRSASSGC